MADEHAAIVRITEKLLLAFLQFQEGRILNARVSPDTSGAIEIVLEHPELPVVEDGHPYEVVCPSYTSHFGENGQLLSIERDREGQPV